jgi:uncharacterized protein YqgC (DUF456 family)
MLPAIHLVVALLMVVGLLGAVVPGLPGTPLILLGAAIHAVTTGFDPIGPWRLALLALLAVISAAAGYLGVVVGTKRAGGSRWAVIGAVVGTLVGLAFAPLGLVVGPLAGAIVAEWLRTGELRDSVRTGIGAALGTIVGTVLHVALALTMVALFLWWIWRG